MLQIKDNVRRVYDAQQEKKQFDKYCTYEEYLETTFHVSKECVLTRKVKCKRRLEKEKI